jgi:hypothetical protein
LPFVLLQTKNSGSHPIEFDCLIGKKMLFTVDSSSNQAAVSDGSYRVRLVCMDPKIIAAFCCDCSLADPLGVCYIPFWKLICVVIFCLLEF